MEKQIIGIRKDGLGGRLISFILALNLSKKLSCKYGYIWLENKACESTFSDLFSLSCDSEITIYQRFDELKSVAKNSIGYLGVRRNFICESIDSLRTSMILDNKDQNSATEEIKERDKLTIIETCEVVVVKPSFETEFTATAEELNPGYFNKVVKPQDEIMQMKDNFLNCVGRDNLVGVHVRRGDIISKKLQKKFVSLEAHIKQMNIFLQDNPQNRFFVSTDSNEVICELKKVFPNKIVHFLNNDYTRTAAGIRAALIDLLILSECSIIQGGKSQFCLAASILGGKKLVNPPRCLSCKLPPKLKLSFCNNILKYAFNSLRSFFLGFFKAWAGLKAKFELGSRR